MASIQCLLSCDNIYQAPENEATIYTNSHCFIPSDVNECSTSSHGCDHVCVNTNGSYYCNCREGFVLSSNGRTCSINCGERLTEMSGSFNSPGWPEDYPQLNFRCVWTVENIPDQRSVAFVMDTTAFGIYNNAPCLTEYIEFFDKADSNGASVGKYCGLVAPEPVIISSDGVRIVFQGRTNQNRPAAYVGVKISYQLVGKWFNHISVCFNYLDSHVQPLSMVR